MKPPAEQLEEIIEEVEGEYTLSVRDLPKDMIVIPVKDTKSILTTHTISILQGEIEFLDGMKQKTYETIGCTGISSDGWCCTKHRDFTKVFDDQITHLEEQIRKIKELS